LLIQYGQFLPCLRIETSTFNLTREFALSDPRGFLRRYKGGVILDEIQRAPGLLSYLQGIVDDGVDSGEFIIYLLPPHFNNFSN